MITLILGLIVWIALIVGTFGVALLILLLGFIGYLFAQSALIAYIRGNGVELSETQFPDLFRQFVACCDRLELRTRPEAYILNGDGGLNAFATKFLGTEFVVLYSEVVDAMERHPDGVRFYMGHELGHLRMKHLTGHLLRWPVLWLPLLGAAYSRARESTCDRHGLACSSTPENAARALAALSAGSQRWEKLDMPSYVRQTGHTTGFWMSLHELTAAYPWLTKRAARVMDIDAAMPKRNPFAYVLAAFLPYAGRLGAGFGLLILVYVVAVLAAVALPAYNDYVHKGPLAVAMIESGDARDKLAAHYVENEEVPESLASIGIAPALASGGTIAMDKEMVLTVTTPKGKTLVFTPSVGEEGIDWTCTGGEGVAGKMLPPGCE